MDKPFNERAQEILEKSFLKEAALMAKRPGGAEAIRKYSDRLLANRKKQRKGVTVWDTTSRLLVKESRS